MTFEEMLPLLKQGKKMVRANWEGTELWVELVDDKVFKGEVMNPYFVIKTEDEAFSIWEPTSCDVLANDWVEVLDEI